MRPSRRRLTEQGADLAARVERLTAENAQLLSRAEEAEQQRDETEAKRRNLARWLAEANATTMRLEGRNKALGERLLEAQVANGFNPVEARRTAERIAILQKAAAAGREEATLARAEARREKKRGDRLQKELDDATYLAPGRPQDSARWQPGYQDPTPDKTASQ